MQKQRKAKQRTLKTLKNAPSTPPLPSFFSIQSPSISALTKSASALGPELQDLFALLLADPEALQALCWFQKYTLRKKTLVEASKQHPNWVVLVLGLLGFYGPSYVSMFCRLMDRYQNLGGKSWHIRRNVSNILMHKTLGTLKTI